MGWIVFLYKSVFYIWRETYCVFTTLACRLILFLNGVKHGRIVSNGLPIINRAKSGSIRLGNGIILNNGHLKNSIANSPCQIYAGLNAEIVIGNNVGISSSVITSRIKICIGNDVLIGAGVLILDTDCHPLDSGIRSSCNVAESMPITICDGVFIGARATILKGVTIGVNSVIGAGAIVTKSIPANQIWAGNPARFIRNLPHGS